MGRTSRPLATALVLSGAVAIPARAQSQAALLVPSHTAAPAVGDVRSAAPFAPREAAAPAAGDTSRVAPVVYHGRSGALNVAMPRLDDPGVRVDGTLSEAAWSSAALLTGFSQWQPVDGTPAADSTEVFVFYTDHAIYFGIRAWEPHGAVNATLADRDRIDGDDHIHIMLDTFNDRRRALLFGVNALGVQADGVVADAADGRSIDLSPDFLFESRGRMTDFGYEIEVRVPFKSVRYQSERVQTWGINVLRRVQHSGQQQTWAPVLRRHPTFLGQGGTLQELSDLKRGLVLDVNPTLTERRAGLRLSDTEFRRAGPERELGLNLRWGVTANLTANGTVNPDFSQVESDVGQVVYDPRQALSFPEKRPFFLEGNENFAVPNSLVYTRRVVQPVAAVKLNGKVGETSVGVLSAVDDTVASRHGEHPLINLVRLRRDVGRQSTLGLVYTDRIDGDDFNRVLAADTRFVFGPFALAAQLGSSFTRRNDADMHWRPIFDATLSRSGRDWGFTSRFTGTHPQFRADAGFVSRPGIVRANFTPRRSWYPQGRAVEAVHLSTIFDGTWTYDRFRDGTEPNDMKWQNRLQTQWRGGWNAGLFTFVESFLYPEELYRNYYIERRDPRTHAVLDTVPYTGTHRLPNYGLMVNVGTPQFQNFSAGGELLFARDDNFEEWSSAWIFFANVSAEWRPTDRIRISGRYLEQRFHRYSDGSLVKLQWIPRMKMEYQVTRAVFVRVIGEYNGYRRDALRDDSRTDDPVLIRTGPGTFRRAVAEERGSFRGDALFSYQPRPGTVLFLGYGSTLNDDAFLRPRDLVRTSDGFFAKVSYLFRT